jgi:hypothetical protein
MVIALSSRFSRRPTGSPLVATVQAVAGEQTADRLVCLNLAEDREHRMSDG